MTLKMNFAVHGYAGAGKSRLTNSAPGPRVTLDAEGGTKWLAPPSHRTEPWDPARPMPTTNIDGSPLHTDTLVPVIVHSLDPVKRLLDILMSGNHPFESVGWDSITDIQTTCKKGIRGLSDSMTEQQWGKLLDQMVDLVRAYRNLTDHTTHPVNVVMTALSQEKGKDTTKVGPDLQGALAGKFPQYFDVVGHLYAEVVTNDKGDQVVERRLLIQPIGPFIAKDRTDILSRKYGLYIPDPNLTVISAVLNGEV